jgi:2-oxoglutarate dehydrogenase complex dehydrogenase (E1) component-like enzyme
VVARDASASPATGSASQYHHQQTELLAAAFGSQ